MYSFSIIDLTRCDTIEEIEIKLLCRMKSHTSLMFFSVIIRSWLHWLYSSYGCSVTSMLYHCTFHVNPFPTSITDFSRTFVWHVPNTIYHNDQLFSDSNLFCCTPNYNHVYFVSVCRLSFALYSCRLHFFMYFNSLTNLNPSQSYNILCI